LGALFSRKDKQRPKAVGKTELFLENEALFPESRDAARQRVIGKNILSGCHEPLHL
jgi:hypothetical protein